MGTISKNELEKEFNKFIVNKNMHIIDESMKSSIYDGFKAGYNLRKKLEKHNYDLDLHNIIFEKSGKPNEKKIIPKIENAIQEVLGMELSEYATKSRKMEKVFARMIFSYHCRCANMNLQSIAIHIKRNHSSVVYLVKKYKEQIQFYPHFRKMAEEVEKIIK